ncbi:hypothetical protein [Candidatus Palauibacter sp.]|uniref:hypothetical protein n=1 Tax=Candidatus Palauibacter sp. TaxID=3101350 RepID=UPI003B01A5FC
MWRLRGSHGRACVANVVAEPYVDVGPLNGQQIPVEFSVTVKPRANIRSLYNPVISYEEELMNPPPAALALLTCLVAPGTVSPLAGTTEFIEIPSLPGALSPGHLLLTDDHGTGALPDTTRPVPRGSIIIAIQ